MTLPVPGPPIPAPPTEVPPHVRAALARLETLQDAPVAGHVAIFDEVHRLLQDALATLDDA